MEMGNESIEVLERKLAPHTESQEATVSRPLEREQGAIKAAPHWKYGTNDSIITINKNRRGGSISNDARR